MCNEEITQVYHQLFDEAQQRYNEKQKRADRKIENYYEKIRTGKQEKTFHEIILQIGDRDDMSATDENGELAKRILDEYFQLFQERNPYLKVFSAHLHMDESTPHLHIDFVPFTTGSKRGMDTRVSLKQALANQGFIGSSKHESEWSLWVLAEKKELATVMQRYGIEWEHKGTNEKHLSDYDYKKKMRAEEVETLTKQSEELNIKVDELNARVREFKNAMDSGLNILKNNDTLLNWINHYLESIKNEVMCDNIKESEYKTLKARLQYFVDYKGGLLAKTRLNDILTSHIQPAVNALYKENPSTGKTTAKKTIQRYIRALANVFEFARKERAYDVKDYIPSGWRLFNPEPCLTTRRSKGQAR